MLLQPYVSCRPCAVGGQGLYVALPFFLIRSIEVRMVKEDECYHVECFGWSTSIKEDYGFASTETVFMFDCSYWLALASRKRWCGNEASEEDNNRSDCQDRHVDKSLAVYEISTQRQGFLNGYTRAFKILISRKDIQYWMFIMLKGNQTSFYTWVQIPSQHAAVHVKRIWQIAQNSTCTDRPVATQEILFCFFEAPLSRASGWTGLARTC